MFINLRGIVWFKNTNKNYKNLFCHIGKKLIVIKFLINDFNICVKNIKLIYFQYLKLLYELPGFVNKKDFINKF